MSKDQDPQCRGRVVPRLEPLEDRVLLSAFEFLPLSAFDFLPLLPRTGGAAMQVGSTLEIGVSSPLIPGFGISSTLIVDEGGGNVAVEWDGTPPHFFSGIDTITLNGTAPGNLAFFVSLTPQSSPQQVAVQMSGVFNALIGLVTNAGAPINIQHSPSVFSLVI